jgi:hypothetical protein
MVEHVRAEVVQRALWIGVDHRPRRAHGPPLVDGDAVALARLQVADDLLRSTQFFDWLEQWRQARGFEGLTLS